MPCFFSASVRSGSDSIPQYQGDIPAGDNDTEDLQLAKTIEEKQEDQFSEETAPPAKGASKKWREIIIGEVKEHLFHSTMPMPGILKTIPIKRSCHIRLLWKLPFNHAVLFQPIWAPR